MNLVDFYQVLTQQDADKEAESKKLGRRRQAWINHRAGEVARRRQRRAVANASRRRNRGR